MGPQVCRVGRREAGESFRQLVAALSSPDVEFVSVDSEFTGWGKHRDLTNSDQNLRYMALREEITGRAVLSLGISVFQRCKARASPSYRVTAMELNLHCTDEFVISPDAGAFLARHGFSFEKMFLEGIRYKRAATDPKAPPPPPPPPPPPTAEELAAKAKVDEDESVEGKRAKKKRRKVEKKAAASNASSTWDPLPRGLLRRIGLYKLPLVLHNGLMDLMFLYAMYEGPLPDSLQGFISAVRRLIAELYDTKYLMQMLGERVTFLEYAFEKSRRHGRIAWAAADPDDDFRVPEPNVAAKGVDDVEESLDICEQFAVGGFCTGEGQCRFSHNVARIVDRDVESTGKENQAMEDEAREASRRKKLRARQRAENSSAPMLSFEQLSMSATRQAATQSKAHSAGHDALSTGFVYATSIARLESNGETPATSAVNRICTFGRGNALLFEESDYNPKC